MLWTIAVILFVLWALGLVTSYTLSGYIHIFLVLALVAVILGIIQGRRAGLFESHDSKCETTIRSYRRRIRIPGSPGRRRSPFTNRRRLTRM